MRNLFFLTLFFLVPALGKGQHKTISIPETIKKYDTAYWSNRIKEDSNEAGLPNLIKTNDALYFRYSTDVQSIDIWTEDFKNFHGTFANFTIGNTYKRDKKKLPREFYFDVRPIDTLEAKEIYTLFSSLKVFNIPSQDSISGWKQGCDGMGYNIEYSTPHYYSFKSYWSPNAEGNLKEAVIMDTLINKLEKRLKLHQSFYGFIDCLPAGLYGGGGIVGIATSVTHKEKKGSYRRKELNYNSGKGD